MSGWVISQGNIYGYLLSHRMTLIQGSQINGIKLIWFDKGGVWVGIFRNLEPLIYLWVHIRTEDILIYLPLELQMHFIVR